MASGNPLLPIYHTSHSRHTSRFGSLLLRQQIPLPMATEFFAECFSPSQDQLAVIGSKYILWETMRDTPYTSTTTCRVVTLSHYAVPITRISWRFARKAASP